MVLPIYKIRAFAIGDSQVSCLGASVTRSCSHLSLSNTKVFRQHKPCQPKVAGRAPSCTLRRCSTRASAADGLSSALQRSHTLAQGVVQRIQKQQTAAHGAAAAVLLSAFLVAGKKAAAGLQGTDVTALHSLTSSRTALLSDKLIRGHLADTLLLASTARLRDFHCSIDEECDCSAVSSIDLCRPLRCSRLCQGRWVPVDKLPGASLLLDIGTCSHNMADSSASPRTNSAPSPS